MHLALPHALACWVLLLNGRAVRVSTCGSSSPFDFLRKVSPLSQFADGIILILVIKHVPSNPDVHPLGREQDR
jgi:hypothetical protein